MSNTHLNYAKSIDFGVKNYLEGRFEGWMKRKGYDIQDDKFHDWFMNGYWGSEIKPKEDKYLEVYNYGSRLASTDDVTDFGFKSVAKAKKAHQSPVANFIIRRMDRLDQLINEAKASNKPYGEYIKESNFLNSIYSKFVQAGYAIDK